MDHNWMMKLRTLWKNWKSGIQESRTELPFFWFLTVVLLIITAASLYYNPFISLTARILFIMSMVAHILMYWLVLALDTQNNRHLTSYLALQFALILAILWTIKVVLIAPAILMTFIGQISGMPITGRKKFTAISVWVLLLFVYIWRTEPQFFTQPALASVGFLLVIVFQLIFTSVYNRTAVAKHQAQEALEKLEIANMKIEQMTRSSERQRIARELHDTLAQGLTGLILQLDAVDVYLEKGESDKAQQLIQRSMRAARATLAESRLVIDDLRQSPPPDMLRQKLEEMVEDINLHDQLLVDLPQDLTSAESELLEKVIGEALANIRQHAHAREILVLIHSDETGFQVRVEDDGIGFNINQSTAEKGHYGLMGMRERIQSAGGDFQITSQPGKGCQLFFTFPRIHGGTHA